MATLLEHAFARHHAPVPLAADPTPGTQAPRDGICRRLCVTLGPSHSVAGREPDARTHTDVPCASDPWMRGVAIVRWVACAQPTTVMMSDTAQYAARTVFEPNDVAPLLSVNIRLANCTPLAIGAVVVLERPMMEPLRCVVDQRLARVNRYRLLELTSEELTR
jgi:hypothetical protein